MSYWADIFLAILFCSNLAGFVYYRCHRARMRNYVDVLRARLSRKEQTLALVATDVMISSDFLLLREFSNAPLARCQPLQVWLLRKQKMNLDSICGSIWVNVERVGINFKLTGEVAGARLSCYGDTFNRACENFNNQLAVRQGPQKKRA